MGLIEVKKSLNRKMDNPSSINWNITLPYCYDRDPDSEDDPLWEEIKEEFSQEKRKILNVRNQDQWSSHEWEEKTEYREVESSLYNIPVL